MILSSAVSSGAFISGTINFLVGSIRQAEELSTTVVPAAANFGAHSKDVSPPAEKIARSGSAANAVSKPITVYSLFPNVSFLPIDLSEATNNNSVIGKFRSANILSITSPTIPVAPTTATFIINRLKIAGTKVRINGYATSQEIEYIKNITKSYK